MRSKGHTGFLRSVELHCSGLITSFLYVGVHTCARLEDKKKLHPVVCSALYLFRLFWCSAPTFLRRCPPLQYNGTRWESNLRSFFQKSWTGYSYWTLNWTQWQHHWVGWRLNKWGIWTFLNFTSVVLWFPFLSPLVMHYYSEPLFSLTWFLTFSLEVIKPQGVCMIRHGAGEKQSSGSFWFFLF